MKQAESASRAAESMMKGGGGGDPEDSAELNKMKEQIAKVWLNMLKVVRQINPLEIIWLSILCSN